ncbi:MAG: 1,3-beta-galactosyl-N-acetylhexosamine phosphorylase [Clostridia bacterium]|nr:1,3-beta-galactosyl-N-acetylhexosamine phosphorylase [Clostridia bacterium]
MSKGRLTIPTDESFVEGTKEIIEKWGADAVRDCDGTKLPENVSDFGCKVYKTYFLARGNNDFAYSHKEYLQNIALISERYMAETDEVEIDPLLDYYEEQVEINDDENSVLRWQVFDRTSGEEVKTWKYDGKTKKVKVWGAEKMHEYTLNFFAKSLWDATQIYNYNCNGWTVRKDRDIDPVFPVAADTMKSDLEKWLKDNPQVNVVRFTTFFYHFFLVHARGYRHQKYFDWFGYPTSASPTMFDKFEEEYGYKITLEDVIDNGYFANCFREPTKTVIDYMNFVEKFVTQKVRVFTDLVHSYGKEAMMFLGDNWIGGEIYGEKFKDMGLDAVVGSVNSGATLRMLSEIPYLKYTEARFLPYFFPDTLFDDDFCVKYLKDNWRTERRAIMRKPVDRIGFGGYLSIAAKYPVFVESVGKIADEFRDIYDKISVVKPYSSVKVAMLNSWGKKRSWMTHMVCQDAPYQKIQNYQGILEALAGLPVDVNFINFDDVINGKLDEYDVVFNYGDEETAFTGGEVWKDPEVTSKIREYVFNGGGFIGLGKPSSVQFGGQYFQLASVLGVDEERGVSIFRHKFNYEKSEGHFITQDVNGETDYGNDLLNIYALEGTEILDIAEDKYLGKGINAGHVKMAVNKFGKGRSFYATGLKYNAENARLLYRAILWCADKENSLKKAFSTDVYTECSYYPEKKLYAIINNSDEERKTVFYDIDGNSCEYTLQGGQLIWIEK